MSKYYKVEDIRHIIIQNAINNKKTRVADLIDIPAIEVSEDAISREYLEEQYWQTLIPKGMVNTDIELGINIGIDKMHDVIKNAPSVLPTTENEIKLCRNCDNAYLYQDCLYCDEIEEETEIEPDDACSLWKLRESSVKPKEGINNFWVTLIATALTISLLAWGGFFK